jgi:uncharacterized protein (TIGR03000 family)
MFRILVLTAALAVAGPAFAQRGGGVARGAATGRAAAVGVARPGHHFGGPARVFTTGYFFNVPSVVGFGFPYSPGYGLPQFPFNYGLPTLGGGFGFGGWGWGYGGVGYGGGGSYLGYAPSFASSSGLVGGGGYMIPTSGLVAAGTSVASELAAAPAPHFLGLHQPADAVARAERVLPPGSAMITMKVPARAEVLVQGQPTSQTGSTRVFLTPPLAGASTYEVKVRWESQGKPVEQTLSVPVRPGDSTSVQILS